MWQTWGLLSQKRGPELWNSWGGGSVGKGWDLLPLSILLHSFQAKFTDYNDSTLHIWSETGRESHADQDSLSYFRNSFSLTNNQSPLAWDVLYFALGFAFCIVRVFAHPWAASQVQLHNPSLKLPLHQEEFFLCSLMQLLLCCYSPVLPPAISNNAAVRHLLVSSSSMQNLPLIWSCSRQQEQHLPPLSPFTFSPSSCF